MIPAALLAFGFVSPWMLWGVALGAAPIVIHLLYRQRYRETPWAAMRFLTAAIRKQSQRMRLEQWLLLAVRTAILLLIALALSGPTLGTLSAFNPGSSGTPAHRILVIDASLSMTYAGDQPSRFDQARDIARNILKSSRQGDLWNLVRIGGISPATIIRRPTAQADAVSRELEQMTGLEEVGDLAATLKDVESLLQAVPELTRKEVYLLTDLQATTWEPGDSAAVSRIRQSLQNITSAASISLFPLGSTLSAANSAVSIVEPVGALHRSQDPVPVRVGLRRFGSTNAAQTVEFFVDQRLQESREVNVVSGSETILDWSPRLTAGEHRLEVRLSPDGLRADDRRGVVVSVSDRLPVLLVNGRPSGQPWENATDLLKLALAPDDSSPFAPTVIPESELISTPLASYGCVFLCNVALITDREARALAEYLNQGGAVVFCLGSQVRLDQYNQVLLSGESPLLPARLVEVVGDPKSTETAYEFDPGDFSHPIIKPFQGNPNSGLELTKTFAYVKTEVPPDRGAQVALRFQTGDPAILTAGVGHGRVVLITTSVDREWSTWAVWGHSFIPVMHEVVRYAVADRFQGRQLLVSERLTGQADQEAVRAATVVLPNDETVNLSVQDRQIVFDQTLQSGFYQLRWGPPMNRTDWYAVNVDLVESDLAALDESALNSVYPVTADWNVLSGDGQLLPASPVALETPGALAAVGPFAEPWSRYLLLLAFWLLLVEQGLAWKFPVGMMVLGAGALVVAIQLLAGSTSSTLEFVLKLAGPLIAVALVLVWQRRRLMPR